MTDGLKRYYSQKWCQGFCGSCGTSCADYCENAKTMKANLEHMTAERDEAVRGFKDIETDYNDCIKSSADELERHGHMSIERFSDYEKRIVARDSTAPVLLEKGGDGSAGDEGARALGSGAELTEEMQ